MSVSIVPMTEAHLPALAAIERACFPTPWTEADLRAELSNDTAVFRVAVDEAGTVLGYGGMHFVCGEGYIDNIATAPEARRQGIGTAVVSALLQYARMHDGTFVTLEVRPSNEAALALYRKLGFQQAGRRKGFYTHPPEDALLLTHFFGHEDAD